LPDDDFEAAVRIAQDEFDRHKPDVVVGSSRGGAVAMNLKIGSTPSFSSVRRGGDGVRQRR
jgi:alpha-beta hydrolase superfamily lysophospholipase